MMRRPQRPARPGTPAARTPTDAFAEFMRRHGDFFPEKPADVDELIDVAGPPGGRRRAADALAVARSSARSWPG